MSEKKAKKSLGQNFLKDKEAINLMINSLNIEKGDNLIEIGGGRGALTQVIIQNNAYASLSVYEIDKDLKPLLQNILRNDHRNSLKFENFLDTNLDNFESYKIIGSLPYYITSPIIHKILRQQSRPEACLFLVQKEVGEKLTSQTPRASYWTYITLGFKVEKISIVKANAFYPEPKVDSMIIRFTKDHKAEELFTKIEFKKWEKFLHHVYKNPRKMINKTFNKELLNKLEIDSNLRPQNLTLEDILKLYKK